MISALGFLIGFIGSAFLWYALHKIGRWYDGNARIARRLQKYSTKLTTPNATIKASAANSAIRISSSMAGV